jgi:hypothetical protein
MQHRQERTWPEWELVRLSGPGPAPAAGPASSSTSSSDTSEVPRSRAAAFTPLLARLYTGSGWQGSRWPAGASSLPAL